MILEKMKVKNFRLLKDFELDFKEELTLVIGKNNCGKTSSLIILDKMLKPSKIIWNDINLECQKELYENIINEVDITLPFEVINLKLFIKYDDNDDYTNIQKFMMDLDENNDKIVLEFVTHITKNKLNVLVDDLNNRKINEFTAFSKYMSKNFMYYFETKRYSRRFDVESNDVSLERSSELDLKDIQKVIRVNGVRADRAVSNEEKNHALSKLTSKYFESYKGGENEKDIVFSKLEKKLEEADKELNSIYNGNKDEKNGVNSGIFSDIINVVKSYGGAEVGVDIAIESSISEKNLMADNTVLHYMHDGDLSLPETYNGLGYLNLIGILIEIETKVNELLINPAEINLLYIEEPEAHTHPQLQYIFIRNIKAHIRKHRENLIEQKCKSIQLLITSHSSHIVSECDFTDIVYLRKIDNAITAKNFDSLMKEYAGKEEVFKFVKQYLTVGRSELLFADKAICVEGDTERMLMPLMMHKVDSEVKGDDMIPLLSQNISIIEVGAYSHVFIPLFKFLGTKVLIITDLDSVKYDSGTDKQENIEKKKQRHNRRKCHPSEGTHTSNQSIINFFEDDGIKNKNNQIEFLEGRKDVDKIKDEIRIAYQIPETPDGYQARSFEDAFIAINKKFLIKNLESFKENGGFKQGKWKTIGKDYYKFAANKIEKKSSFASCILYYDKDEGSDDERWNVPKYIKEGLLWLR